MKKPDKITRINEAMWDSRARTYDRTFGFLRGNRRKLVALLDLGNNPVMLDIACGTGWALCDAADRANGHGEFYGIDLSEKMIEQAAVNLANYRNVHLGKANAEELPFNNDFFDYIICSNAFHHFSDPDRVVKEACRVLNSHGRFYVLDSTADSFIIRLADRLMRKLESGHVKTYSTREYKAFFQRAGLNYVAGKSISWSSWKIHIGEKPS